MIQGGSSSPNPWVSQVFFHGSVLQCFNASVLQVTCGSSRRGSRRRSPLRTVMNEAPGTDWRFEVDQTKTSKVTKT